MFELTDVQTDLVEEPEEAGFGRGGERGVRDAGGGVGGGVRGVGGGGVGGDGIRNRGIEFGEIIFRRKRNVRMMCRMVG